MSRAELALARGKALEILQDYLNRPREVGTTSDPAYMVEDLLHELLALRGYPMSRWELSGSVMTYLKDAGLVDYRISQPGGPKGPVLLHWRILHDGFAILEGTKTDRGVKIL